MNSDMSARAVATRLKRVAQLRSLCISLGKAGPSPEAVRLAGQGSTKKTEKKGKVKSGKKRIIS